MLIKLLETLVCLCLCCSVTTSYINVKTSERTPRKIITSHYPDSYNKHSRYTKFDKVMTRINNLNFDDGSSQHTHKFRHKGNNRKPVTTTPSTTTTTTTTTEIDLFETYGELENEDYFDDYDGLDDEDDELDYEDEDDEDLFDEIQAEEPTEKPTTTIAPRPVSKLTEYKWTHYGTAERVEESRRQHLNLHPSKEQLTAKAAEDHYARVNQQSKCRTPLPRVIPVQQEHPNPTRNYLPACTVLYRCAEDSGCCKRDTRCQYKTRELVSLYFYVNTVGQSHSTVEKLEFYNHTECTCKERTEIPPESVKDADTEITSKTFETKYQNNVTLEKNNDRCNCPKPYELTEWSPNCVCDCGKNELDCIQLKKGKEHFSMTNRICIQEETCGLPTCEYGTYMIIEGKCPTKQDKLEEFRKLRMKL